MLYLLPVVEAVKALHEFVILIWEFAGGEFLDPLSAVEQPEKPDCQQEFMVLENLAPTGRRTRVPRSGD